MTSATFTPVTREELAAVLADHTSQRRTLRIRGGGSASRRGLPRTAEATLSTRGLDRIVAYEPDDLTLTVEAGVSVAQVQALVGARRQTWPQAPDRDGATVGGVLAGATGGLTRLRWGPARDALLEVVVATGDGRLVRAGGRTVKGVAGFDIPRLMVGALGTLGVIVEATLKLWPEPAAHGWYMFEGDPATLHDRAVHLLGAVYRPGAVLVTPTALWLLRMGAPDDVTAMPDMTACEAPQLPTWAATMQVGVSPAHLGDLCAELRALGVDFIAQMGVGSCLVELRTPSDVAVVRARATGLGGHAEVIDAPDAFRDDPWGPAPPGIAIMRRLRTAFDPAHVLNPGCFVGDAAAPV